MGFYFIFLNSLRTTHVNLNYTMQSPQIILVMKNSHAIMET